MCGHRYVPHALVDGLIVIQILRVLIGTLGMRDMEGNENRYDPISLYTCIKHKNKEDQPDGGGACL